PSNTLRVACYVQQRFRHHAARNTLYEGKGGSFFITYYLLLIKKVSHPPDKCLGLLNMREMSRVLDECQSRPWDGISLRCAVLPGCTERSPWAQKNKSRNIYSIQSRPQLGVMKIRFPAIAPGRLRVAGKDCHLVTR